MFRLPVILFILVSAQLAYGQSEYYGAGDYGSNLQGVIYSKEFSMDVRFMTNKSWAVAANFGTIQTYYKTRYYHFEIGELRHPKEFRQNLDNVPAGGGSSNFIFGKINNLLVARAGIGQKRYFSEKAKRRGVVIGASYEGGLSLGILKPYYLDIIASSGTGRVIVQKSYEDDPDLFLNPSFVRGASGFGKGIEQSKIKPGGHFKAAVHIDWGAFDEFVKAIEVGIAGDIFFSKMDIMAPVDGAENRSYFINLFAAIQFGKRW